jgi:6,7-dimethyl-8-ribityllumazine synthase
MKKAVKPVLAIVRSKYRPEIVDLLFQGATAVLKAAGAEYSVYEVAGSLEIPAAVELLQKSGKRFDGYVTLGCVMKGATIHDEVIAYTIFPALDQIARRDGVAIGNGVLTVSTEAQAFERADPNFQDRGGEAARAALGMIGLRAILSADEAA